MGRAACGKERDQGPDGRRGEASGHYDGGGATQRFSGYEDDRGPSQKAENGVKQNTHTQIIPFFPFLLSNINSTL